MLDFIGFINTNWGAPAEEKAALLEKFTRGLHYQETVKDEFGIPIPNPETRRSFANRKITEYIVRLVNGITREDAERELVIDEVVLE